jgi:hypothetical protein
MSRAQNTEEQARLADQAKTFPVTRLPYLGPPRETRADESDKTQIEQNARQVERSRRARVAKRPPLLSRLKSVQPDTLRSWLGEK